MKTIISILLFAVVLALSSSEKIVNKEDCHCHEGFLAKTTPDKGYKCFGVLLKLITNCNTIKRPRCVCTEATGILSDESGTHCVEYRSGREIQKWNCENQADWEKFFTEYPGERFVKL
uniref:Uncharacterized protein LOC114335001 isoform X1 n=1 Tax=Diabrotica virgifera virgifera TaxID=50390 RepID=A0A6P7G8Z3_DIAVI